MLVSEGTHEGKREDSCEGPCEGSCEGGDKSEMRTSGDNTCDGAATAATVRHRACADVPRVLVHLRKPGDDVESRSVHNERGLGGEAFVSPHKHEIRRRRKVGAVPKGGCHPCRPRQNPDVDMGEAGARAGLRLGLARAEAEAVGESAHKCWGSLVHVVGCTQTSACRWQSSG